MAGRTGWHCTACNRYFQRPADEPPPAACQYCDETGSLRRIDHPDRGRGGPEVAVGDVVACRRRGEVEEYVVGTAVEVGPDGITVDARDGTGRYAVAPDDVVRIRRHG